MSSPSAAMSPVAYRFPSFRSVPLRHGLSGRVPSAPYEGSISHLRDTDPEAIEANRTAFLDEVGIRLPDLTLGRQTHAANVQLVNAAERGRGLYPTFDGFPQTDALITADPTVATGVSVSDCVPLLLYDPVRHAVGVAHAGWRGTVAGIAAAAVRAMAEAFGTDPADLQAGIGPSIGPCCYEVGDEVLDGWARTGIDPNGRAVVRTPTGYHYDLWTANRLTLLAAGVSRRRIEDSALCVRCFSERFFSHRAAKQGLAAPGGMLLVAQLDARPG